MELSATAAKKSLQQLLQEAQTGNTRLDLLCFLHRSGFLFLTLVSLFWASTLIIQCTVFDPTRRLRIVTGFATYITTVVSAWRVAENLGPDLEIFPLTITAIVSACFPRRSGQHASNAGHIFQRRPDRAAVEQDGIEMEVVRHDALDTP